MRGPLAVGASVCLVLALGQTGCSAEESAGEPTSEPSATATSQGPAGEEPPVCAELDAVRQSITDLQDTGITRATLDELAAELRSLQGRLRRLADGAGAAYAPEVDALQVRADALRASVAAAASDPSATTLGEVRDDLRALASAVDLLGEAVADTCVSR